MEELLKQFCEKLREALGEEWTVKPHHIAAVAYYFICEKDGIFCLTQSYGMYASMNMETIISREVPALKQQYAILSKRQNANK